MEGFCKLLEDCGLKDMGYKSPWYMWTRDNLPETSIHERLDRVVGNRKWFDMFSEAELRHLPHFYLDHCPIFLILTMGYNRKSSNRFYFESW